MKYYSKIILVLCLIIFLVACDAQKNIEVTEKKPIYNNNEKEPVKVAEPVKNSTKIFPLPLMDMLATDKYQNEDGGLYGKGMNTPPESHRQAVLKEVAKIQLLDKAGKPSSDGKIGFVSLGMKNTDLEFSVFKSKALSDPAINKNLIMANGAQSGKDVYVWATNSGPWAIMKKSVEDSGLTQNQVQVAWIKMAESKPTKEFPESARDYQENLKKVILRLKAEYPNVRIAYLSSRICGGYDTNNWNPEPYAYESAFAIRWLILDQANGNIGMNYDISKGSVKAPILVWGPYMWANADNARSDGLKWESKDFESDGSTPAKSGLDKTSQLLMDYFKFNEFANSWFLEK